MNTGNTETDTCEGARTIESETHSSDTGDEVQGGDEGDLLQNYNEVVQREYKGVVVGTKNMDDVENMAIRDDDVFVVTFPRSGTTVTQELTFLISTGDFETAKSVLLDERFPYLDFDLRGPNFPYFRGVKWIDEKPSPRFIKSHFHHFLLPRQLRDGKGKIIYVARNPRDVLVSYYKLQRWFGFETRTFQQYFEHFISGKHILSGSYWSHLKQFWELRNERNILFLKYEDIIKDMTATVKQISSFLDKHLTDFEIARIVEHCQIQNMKENRCTNWTYVDEQMKTDKRFGTFINTGKVGHVEGFYTEQMLKRMHAKFEEEFSGSGLVFTSFPNTDS